MTKAALFDMVRLNEVVQSTVMFPEIDVPAHTLGVVVEVHTMPHEWYDVQVHLEEVGDDIVSLKPHQFDVIWRYETQSEVAAVFP